MARGVSGRGWGRGRGESTGVCAERERARLRDAAFSCETRPRATLLPVPHAHHVLQPHRRSHCCHCRRHHACTDPASLPPRRESVAAAAGGSTCPLAVWAVERRPRCGPATSNSAQPNVPRDSCCQRTRRAAAPRHPPLVASQTYGEAPSRPSTVNIVPAPPPRVGDDGGLGVFPVQVRSLARGRTCSAQTVCQRRFL